MSIGIYAFLRIYFFWLWAVRFCTVSDTLHALQRPATGTICPVWAVWYRVQTGAACLTSGRACLALPPIVCRRSGCAGGGWCLHLWGIWREPGVGRSTPRVEKIQKRRFSFLPTPSFPRKTPYPPIVNLKNFPQKQKDPYKGSAFCAILALQALKGRNLQWLKVK